MNIPPEETKALQKVLPNYRSEGTIRDTRIIITGSVLGRYEKEPDNPLFKEANQYYVDAIVNLIAKKLILFNMGRSMHRLRGIELMKAMPGIAQERPKLVSKILRFASAFLEDFF